MINVALEILPHTLPDHLLSILDEKSIDYITTEIMSDLPAHGVESLRDYIIRRKAHEAYDDLHPHLADMNELEAQTFIAMLNKALLEGHLFDAPSDDEIEAIDDSEVH
jgi:hypothetical protein